MKKDMHTLETERLILRDFALTDWDTLNAMLSDSLVTQYMHFATWDEEQRRNWLAQLAQEEQASERVAYNRAITLRSDGLLIGWLGIGNTIHSSEKGVRECGYALDHHFWGQGYMPEALKAVIAYEFTVLGMPRIIAECETVNTASARVMQKSGLKYEGTFYDADFQGNWKKRHRYGISNSYVK
jgi:RimJ/RimL family protein N-acetyltransferase